MGWGKRLLATGMVFMASATVVQAAPGLDQSQSDALRLLAPFSELQGPPGGSIALQRNLAITGQIQDGSAHQPLLLPFAKQQRQALVDAFMTTGNASQLADGLGSELAGIYQKKAYYAPSNDWKGQEKSDIPATITGVLKFAYTFSSGHSTLAKYFFAKGAIDKNGTLSPDATKILNEVHGVGDIYGNTYPLRQGKENINKSGNPRPFLTEPKLIVFQAPDYFGHVVTSEAYLYGLKGYALQQPLTESPSYPSGHTTYGYTESLVLALLVPERYPQMIARGAEYGNERIILGAHYAMDVIAGRTLALYDMAHLLSDHEKRLGIVKDPGKPDDFAGVMAAARSDLRKLFEAECRSSVARCARRDLGRFHHLDRVRAFYESTQTYGLPIVFAKTAKRKEDVAKLAPEACALLQAAFPTLSCPIADSILTETEGPGGGFLDDGSPYGVYSRLDLYKAGLEAIAATSAKHAQ